MALKRLNKELDAIQLLSPEELDGISLGSVTDDNKLEWQASIIGPPGTPYEGGVWFLEIKCSARYPFQMPRVRFVTSIYHPFVNENGNFCMPGVHSDSWHPRLQILDLVKLIKRFFTHTIETCVLRADLAEQFNNNRVEFDIAAREHTGRHAV